MKLYTHDGSGIFSIEQTKPEPLVKKESMAVKSTMHTHVGKSGRFTCTCKEPYKTLQATKHMHADDSGLFRCDTCSTAKADPEMIAPKSEKTKAEKTKGGASKEPECCRCPKQSKKEMLSGEAAKNRAHFGFDDHRPYNAFSALDTRFSHQSTTYRETGAV